MAACAAKINMTEYPHTSRGGVDLMPSATELGCLLDRWQTAMPGKTASLSTGTIAASD